MTASNPCCEKCGIDGDFEKERYCQYRLCPCHKETPAAVEILQDAKTGEIIEANGVKMNEWLKAAVDYIRDHINQRHAEWEGKTNV